MSTRCQTGNNSYLLRPLVFAVLVGFCSAGITQAQQRLSSDPAGSLGKKGFGEPLVRGAETPEGCTFAGAGAAITRFPNTSVNHGDRICYTIQYNNGTVDVNCELQNFSAELYLADGTVIPILQNASIMTGSIVTCPSADPRCVTPSNCTIPGRVGYEYIVNHADEVANFNACPPLFTPGIGRIVAYTYGEGDSLTSPPDFANACATANNFVNHGSCCEPCTGTCTPDVSCNECPGDSIFTPNGDCSTGCLLTCGDQDACTTDGVCIPGSGRDNCSATPGGTPATCGPDIHFCDVPPVGFTCDDDNECTIDTCLNDTDPNNPCCGYEPVVCPEPPVCFTQADCIPETGCPPVVSVCDDPAYVCNDNNVCTSDACDDTATGTGCCVFTPIPCEERACYTVDCDANDGCIYTSTCETNPTQCDDGDPCTEDTCDPAAPGCCIHVPKCECGDGNIDQVEACDGDARAPGISCFGPCRGDCTCCGDGSVNGGEFCDGTPGCRTDCTACGDGIINGGEFCDGTPGCRADCTACGDGIVNGGEFCDGTPGCRADCTACGDSIVNGDELCDDGNTDNNDSCSNNCTNGCGNGILNTGEDCDGTEFEAGAPATHGPCRADCSYCGDGTVDSSETCDDGNAIDTDGCRNNCTKCGDGFLDPGEDCDDGNTNNNDLCRNTCEEPVCGDGILDAGEECDGAADEACEGASCQADCTCGGEEIPTVSAWGMAILALLLLIAAKLRFTERQTA